MQQKKAETIKYIYQHQKFPQLLQQDIYQRQYYHNTCIKTKDKTNAQLSPSSINKTKD